MCRGPAHQVFRRANAQGAARRERPCRTIQPPLPILPAPISCLFHRENNLGRLPTLRTGHFHSAELAAPQIETGVRENGLARQLLHRYADLDLVRKPMFCSAPNRFYTSNLLLRIMLKPRATQNRGPSQLITNIPNDVRTDVDEFANPFPHQHRFFACACCDDDVRDGNGFESAISQLRPASPWPCVRSDSHAICVAVGHVII